MWLVGTSQLGNYHRVKCSFQGVLTVAAKSRQTYKLRIDGSTPSIRSSKPEGQSERPTNFTRRAIAAYIGSVLITHDEIWWVPFSEVKGRHSVRTNVERGGLAEYRGTTDGLKKVPAKVAASF